MTTLTTFFGDAERTFALLSPQVRELERLTGKGIGVLVLNVSHGYFSHGDLIETIRLGLIGGGTAPQEALALIDAYAREAPLAVSHALASAILQARYSGKIEAPAGDQKVPANG